MKITPLIYGYSQMKESMAFPGGDPQKSKEFIEEYSKPHYTVSLCHDE